MWLRFIMDITKIQADCWMDIKLVNRLYKSLLWWIYLNRYKKKEAMANKKPIKIMI